MSIFNKRPLCIILLVMLSGFVIFSESRAVLKGVLLTLSIMLCFISCILKHCKRCNVFPTILSLCLLSSFVLSHVYFEMDYKLYNRFQDKSNIVATIEDIKPSSYSAQIVVKVKTIDGKRIASHKILGYIDSKYSHSIDIGDTVSFASFLSDFDDKDSRIYNFSRGISAKAADIEDFKIISRGGFGINKYLSYIREYLSRYAASISDSNSASLLSALLLGERDNLSSQTRLDFKRIGISHILALSGMHLSILSLGINKLLIMLHVNKKPRTVSIIAFVILYMAFTGFSVSVLRAGLMLIISSVLFLLSKSKDSITSLVTAVFLIVLITPYAIYDTALWLSAFATLGILVLSEYLRETSTNDSTPKLLIYVKASLLCTVFAVSFTLLISTVSFGGISLFSLFSTFIFSILTELIMYLGCIMLLLGWILPIKYVFSPLCNITTKLANVFSSTRFAYYANDDTLTFILVIILTLLVAGFAILKIRNKKRFIVLLCLFYAATTLTPFVKTISKNLNTESIVYYSKSKCDEFLIQSDSEVCLINSSQYSKSLAYTTRDLLDEHGITYIDKYVITHYGYNLKDDFETLLSSYLTENIYLPKPQNDEEENILAILEKAVSDYTVKITLYEKSTSIKLGKVIMTPLLNVPYGEDSSMNAFVLYSRGNSTLYLSSGILEYQDSDKYFNYIASSEQVIFGSHGKKYKERTYLKSFDGITKRMIFQSTNLFLTQEALMEQTEKGCEILSHPTKIELYCYD